MELAPEDLEVLDFHLSSKFKEKNFAKKERASIRRDRTGATSRVSHIMPALNLALNADFEKKALKKHY